MTRPLPLPLARLACLLGLLAGLHGCATRPPLSDQARAADWRAHQQHLAGLEDWELSGRMAIRLGEEAWSAGLLWRQDGEEFRLSVIAPLGRGALAISGRPGAVSLRTGEGEVLGDREVDDLMRDRLGWSIPVESLAYWVKGLPAPGPGPEAVVLDEAGRLESLRQAGWAVGIEGYRRVDGYDLPARIDLARPGLTLRLGVTRWDLDP